MRSFLRNRRFKNFAFKIDVLCSCLLLNSNQCELVYINKRVTTYKEFSCTGVSVEIPPRTVALLQLDATYGQGKPISTGVAKSNTSWSDETTITKTSYPQKCFLLHSPQEKATTYYVWANYSAVSDNPIKITGLLFPQ